MKRRVLKIFAEKISKEKRAASFQFSTKDNVILKEFPEPVEGNEVKDLFASEYADLVIISSNMTASS
jgi:hypothetical protein